VVIVKDRVRLCHGASSTGWFPSAQEELQPQAEQVFANTRTPAEEFGTEMNKLNGRVGNGRRAWARVGQPAACVKVVSQVVV
jgi:hypothetical protein